MLRARLLGALEVELDGAVIPSPASQRPWSLFAYLALSPRSVPRTDLAARFWPDVLDQSARASVRSALWVLRRQLGESLVVDGEWVGLRDGDGLWVDVREFERLAPDEPERALALSRGELLEGLEDDWALSARERHRDRVLELLERLALAGEESGELRRAVDFTRRQVERDPFDEQAHRRLMERLCAVGDRAAAVRSYRALSERLRRELGVIPSRRTREVFEQLCAEPGPSTPHSRRAQGMNAPPLVGRDPELAELERVWQRVRGGCGAAAVIRGEAGVGKTRLASELRMRASAAGGLTAACAALDLGGTAPFSLWAELIRELLPSLAAPPSEASWPDDLAVLVSELPAHFARGGAPSPAVAPDLQRTRLFEAIVALLDAATRDAPLLLVLEDVHSADGPSLELTGYAARRVASLPVMMVITRRELPHSSHADRLEQAVRSRGLLASEVDLGPLPAEPVAAIAREAAHLSAVDVGRVIERADGNALLALETAKSLGRGHLEVPLSLRASVRATLAPLSGDARGLIEIAAVAGRPLDPIELGQLPFSDPDESAAHALETDLLLAGDSRIGFRHALLRDAVYEEVADPRRRRLHKRWAQALLASEQLGATPRPAEVARQLRLAGADADAVPQLLRAAIEARGLAALEQAATYLEEALGIAPNHAELWLELGDVEAWRAHRDQSEAAFSQAFALLEPGEPIPLVRALLRRARAYHGLL